jgi:hypothetical protein
MWNLISGVCVDRIDWRRVRRRQDCQAKKEKNKAQFGFKAHPYTPWLTAQSFSFASILKVQLFLKFLPKRVQSPLFNYPLEAFPLLTPTSM